MILRHLLDRDCYFPGLWDLRRDGRAREHWSTSFREHLEQMLDLVEARRGAAARRAAAQVETRLLGFLAGLDAACLGRYPHVHAWTLLRDDWFRDCSLGDPYRELKAQENERALELLPSRLEALAARAPFADQLRDAVASILAGNRFDPGCPRTARAEALRLESLAGPWLVDDLPRLQELLDREARRLVVLVDNAGAEFVCGVVPLGRLLGLRGHRVVLAANQDPSLNDVTVGEGRSLLAEAARRDPVLRSLLGRGDLSLVSTGSRTPGIDLRHVSAELDEACREADLLVLIGQGRALESNWQARLAVPTLRLATIKDALVAERLQARPLDSICELRPAGAGPPFPWDLRLPGQPGGLS